MNLILAVDSYQSCKHQVTSLFSPSISFARGKELILTRLIKAVYEVLYKGHCLLLVHSLWS